MRNLAPIQWIRDHPGGGKTQEYGEMLSFYYFYCFHGKCLLENLEKPLTAKAFPERNALCKIKLYFSRVPIISYGIIVVQIGQKSRIFEPNSKFSKKRKKNEEFRIFNRKLDFSNFL